MKHIALVVTLVALLAVLAASFAGTSIGNQATIATFTVVNASHSPPGVTTPSPIYLTNSVQQSISATRRYPVNVGGQVVSILTRQYQMDRQPAHIRWQPSARYSFRS